MQLMVPDKVDANLRAEEGLIDAIGEVIAHWGFKKTTAAFGPFISPRLST